MDVKIAFLNEDLEDDIYMEQPKSFMALGNEHMPCLDRGWDNVG